MPFTHACFLSFPRRAGFATEFADKFYDHLVSHLAGIDKSLTVFHSEREQFVRHRRGDDWRLWVQRELCHSAMMIAVCAPAYFNSSDGCASEFTGMETLVRRRRAVLGAAAPQNWIIALRLKQNYELPRIDPYRVEDFFECAASPARIKSRRCSDVVARLADEIHAHWRMVHSPTCASSLINANLCHDFRLGDAALEPADDFPHAGGVR